MIKVRIGAVHLGRLRGWAFDPSRPTDRVVINISIEGIFDASSIICNIYREDLKQAQVGDGQYGFEIILPNCVYHQFPLGIVIRHAENEKCLYQAQLRIDNPSRGFSNRFEFKQFLVWSYNEERMPYGQIEDIPGILEVISVERMLRVARSKKAPQTDLVSVIMPVFNRESIVSEAIQSVLAQTYNNLEFIIIDDGSTDNSIAVIMSFDDPRIRLIKLRQNGGVSAARNTGLRTSNGSIIAYIDSDNVWESDYLTVMVDAFRDAPQVRAAYAGQEIWEYLPQYNRDEFRFLRMMPFNRSRLERRNFIDINVFMHRRELYEEFGGFNESMRRLVDWELILRYTEHRPPAFLPVTLGRYRIARADNQITVVEDRAANLALLRLPTPLDNLRIAKAAPVQPLSVFVYASGPEAFETWTEFNCVLVAQHRIFAAWPVGVRAEGLGPDGSIREFESVSAALAACCHGLCGEPLLLISADYILSERWASVYAAALKQGHFDAMTGRLYKRQHGPESRVVFEDQMPLKIAPLVISWQYSPGMHGVVAMQLPEEYLIFPPASVPRLAACATIKSNLTETVSAFFMCLTEGSMAGVYTPDLSAFALCDISSGI